ncbi:MAG: polysaccharide biosynthesis protein [Bacilli bacterium]
MKKNSFVQGAFIATCGIVISKIIGILYVIPFYAIIGEQGGALYGYAYNIYALFLGISQAGIPLAMSKVISEYQALGYYQVKERAFKIGRKTLTILGVVCFLILFIFAPQFAYLIIGTVEGGNTISDVVFVIRMISTAILVVPILSVYRGYLQGHKYIAPTSISQVLEQLVRVTIIIIGSFLTLKVFNLSLKTGVGIAVFAATIGASISYFYLFNTVSKNRKLFGKDKEDISSPHISDKQILSKILMYAFPFIMIDVFRSLYNSIDMVTLVKTLVGGLGYTAKYAESIMSVISTWGLKLNMIVIAITSGVMVSLIPNLTSSFVHKEMDDVRRKINQTLQMLLLITIPMVLGLSFLAGPVWTVFYGSKAALSYGTITYQFYVFVALATSLFTSTITIIQVLKEYKGVFACLISGLGIKIFLSVPLIYGFAKMGLPAFYGAITATILGFTTSSIIALALLKKKYKVNYEETLKKVMSIVGAAFIMIICLFFFSLIIPITGTSRILNILIIMFYALVGGIIYITILYKNHTLEQVFGSEILNIIKSKLKRGKKHGI